MLVEAYVHQLLTFLETSGDVAEVEVEEEDEKGRERTRIWRVRHLTEVVTVFKCRRPSQKRE